MIWNCRFKNNYYFDNSFHCKLVPLLKLYLIITKLKLSPYAEIVNIDFADSLSKMWQAGGEWRFVHSFVHYCVADSFPESTYATRKLFPDCSVANKLWSHTKQTVSH